ncbi:MAG: hypothetical protein ACR2G2_12910 [Pseudonocardia sp.]
MVAAQVDDEVDALRGGQVDVVVGDRGGEQSAVGADLEQAAAPGRGWVQHEAVVAGVGGVQDPQSVAHPGGVEHATPPITKDALGGRLRRLCALAEHLPDVDRTEVG